jgi:hypothetical protein
MLIIGVLSTDPAAVPGTVFLLEGDGVPRVVES